MSFETITDLPQPMQELMFALRREPRDPLIWQQLGNEFLVLNDEARARVCFHRCLTYDPENETVRRRLQDLAVQTERDEDLDFLNLAEIEAKLDATFPAWFQISLSVLSFLFTAMLVFFQEWQIDELVWGFWITSLTTGYAIILISITGMVVGANQPQGKTGRGIPGSDFWGARLLGGLFMLAFFTVHFGMFHFIIGQFLHGFFPTFSRPGLPSSGFVNIPFLILRSLQSFWPLVLLSLATSVGAFRRAWSSPIGNAVAEPYKNVIRMHLSIFALAFFSMAGRSEWLAVVVLLFYYFPWELVLGQNWMKSLGKKSPA